MARRKAETMKKKVALLTSIFLLLGSLSCTNIQKVSEDVFVPVRGAGQLVLYFKPIARGNFHISFQLDSIETETFDGQRIVLSSKVIEVSSREWLDRQIKLAEVSLSPNSYKGIEFKISKAVLQRDEEKITLNIPEGVIRVSRPFQVYSRESTPLFIEWNVDSSIESEVFFKPVMSFFSKEPQLKSLMIYVTQERSNNVVVINRNTDQIVSTIEVGKKPHGIAIQSDINRVYVANSGEDTITIIDIQTNRSIKLIDASGNPAPEEKIYLFDIKQKRYIRIRDFLEERWDEIFKIQEPKSDIWFETEQDAFFLYEGDEKHISVIIRYRFESETIWYYGRLSLQRCLGFVDQKTGELLTSDYLSDPLMFREIINSWPNTKKRSEIPFSPEHTFFMGHFFSKRDQEAPAGVIIEKKRPRSN